jgi:hypothetical protein
MAHSLLDAVNFTAKKAHLIQGESGELSSLTNAAYQSDVDLIVDSIQEVIKTLLTFGGVEPDMSSTGTVTLVDGTREYAPASDFQVLESNKMVNQTDGKWLSPYPGGYLGMFEAQHQPASYVGNPNYYCINPANGNFRLDTTPDSGQDGEVYTYVYQKSLSLSLAADTFPFHDEVVEDLIPAFAEFWKMQRDQNFNESLFNNSLSMAVRKIKGTPMRTRY